MGTRTTTTLDAEILAIFDVDHFKHVIIDAIWKEKMAGRTRGLECSCDWPHSATSWPEWTEQFQPLAASPPPSFLSLSSLPRCTCLFLLPPLPSPPFPPSLPSLIPQTSPHHTLIPNRKTLHLATPHTLTTTTLNPERRHTTRSLSPKPRHATL